MKTAANYKPKYSLSIQILEEILSKRKLQSIITAYVQFKKDKWKKDIKGK